MSNEVKSFADVVKGIWAQADVSVPMKIMQTILGAVFYFAAKANKP